MVVALGGSFANSDASILFFSHSLLLPDEDTCWPDDVEASGGRLPPGPWPLSLSSLGLFLLPIREDMPSTAGGDGVGLRNPKLLSNVSSCYRKKKFSLWINILLKIIPENL